MMLNEEDMQEIDRIKPRTVLYMYSGGKDSSLSLLFTRDFIKDYCENNNCRVYQFYIYITGNTHPFNSYASYSVMLYHKKQYNFEIISRAKEKLFQEYMAKYGLERGSGRWCYNEFKNKVIAEQEKLLPRPILEIDGMSLGDSKWRAEFLKTTVESFERNGIKIFGWHPLFNYKLDREEKLKILEKHEEFKPIIELYKQFGDSMNCIVCPYKGISKYSKENAVENMYAIGSFTDQALKSYKWKHIFLPTKKKTLDNFVCDGLCEIDNFNS